MRALIVALCLVGIAAPAAAAPVAADPLASPMWEFLSETLLGKGAVVRFDPRVRVTFPGIAENQRAFPVAVDARGIAGVKRMIIMADLNPIPKTIDYSLGEADAFIETRIKLDQRTPVRGAVQLADGTWLVGGGWVDAAGGGCSAPPVSRVKGDWAVHLGEIRGRAWAMEGGVARVRLALRHPMDTGFVENIKTYYIEDLRLTSADGRLLGDIAVQASVSEDPAITVLPHVGAGGAVKLSGRDTNGIVYDAVVPVPRASPIGGGAVAGR